MSVSVAVTAAPTSVLAGLFSATLRVSVRFANVGAVLLPVVPTALVTVVAAAARLPLEASSKTVSAASATVSVAVVSVRAVVRVIWTLVPATLAIVVDRVTLLAWMVIRLRATELMVSLNARNTASPSVDVVGASVPVVRSVGRMPSTLWSAAIATNVWSRSAFMVVLPVALMVPPVSLFAAIATPFGAESPTATV